jgi:signal transduction histidine kinase
MLNNLVENALKFSKPGTPPIIRIDCRRVKGMEPGNENLQTDKDYWHISVVDNGIGF